MEIGKYKGKRSKQPIYWFATMEAWAMILDSTKFVSDNLESH